MTSTNRERLSTPTVSTLPILITILIATIATVAGAAEPVPQPVAWTVAAHEGGGGRVLFAPESHLLAIADDPDFAPSFTETVAADENGKVAHDLIRNGWAYCAYTCEKAGTVLVEGRGFYLFFVNGERFPGDIYSHGLLRVPVRMRKGVNHVLVRAIRGQFTMRFLSAEGQASLSPRDPTLPDLREGTLTDAPGAVVVLNHEASSLTGARLEVGDGVVFAKQTFDVATILPFGIAKPPFTLKQLRAPREDELDEKGRYRLPVVLITGRRTTAEHFTMNVRKADAAYRETRLSNIDTSVQYHAVRAPVKVEDGKRYALFLSLHGAGVPAHNQARSYAAKEDAFIVAPTNRRRFGFDWQDWGRLDALETLDWVMEHYSIDPDRVYLTGHSMGGHGTWYLGSLYASRFAAIAPSAGWASFFTYGGGMKFDLGEADVLTPFEEVQLENDTLAFARNLEWTPVYVLHGEKDDNVPASEARLMLAELAKWHRGYVYHEQPGVKHWWGAACVDWPPLFDYCLARKRDPKPLRFTFTTHNPAVSSTYAWARIEMQKKRGRLSRIEVDVDPKEGVVRITTENVGQMHLDLRGVVSCPEVTLHADQTKLVVDPARPHRLWHGHDILDFPKDWAILNMPPEESQGDAWRRFGPFKLAFQNRMVWVYGTSGTPEETRALVAKVRYDASVWWYRGNGNVTVVQDREFTPEKYAGRNVILYGSADSNSAFSHLGKRCPIRVARGKLTVGKTVREGDWGTYFVYPGEGGVLYGVVGATSARAARMIQQARYFISGSAAPDWTVFDDRVLKEGLAGVTDAGWFDSGWRLPPEK
jgi:poly(3-hydroxybutyrate) depolymerase